MATRIPGRFSSLDFTPMVYIYVPLLEAFSVITLRVIISHVKPGAIASSEIHGRRKTNGRIAVDVVLSVNGLLKGLSRADCSGMVNGGKALLRAFLFRRSKVLSCGRRT